MIKFHFSNYLRISRIIYTFTNQNQPNAKIYQPLLPLLAPYTKIFSSSSNPSSLEKHNRTIPLYGIPLVLFIINNTLTSWSLMNCIGLLLTLNLTPFAYNYRSCNLSRIVQAISVDHDLKHLFVLVTKSSFSNKIHEQFPIGNNTQEQLEVFKLDNPYLDPKIDSTHFTTKTQLLHAQIQSRESFKNAKKFEEQTFRLKLPLQQIIFQVVTQKQTDKLQYIRDCQRLSPLQMIKKYENYPIQIILPKELKVTFTIAALDNTNRRYHDYLIALAHGFQIKNKAETKHQGKAETKHQGKAQGRANKGNDGNTENADNIKNNENSGNNSKN